MLWPVYAWLTEGRLAQRESTALTTQPRRVDDQGRCAKCLVNAYFLSTDDIHRYLVTGI
jgi:hypothetical protein